MKSFLTIMLLILFALSINAQDEKSQISFSYGIVTWQGNDDDLSNMFSFVFFDPWSPIQETSSQSKTSTAGLFELRYKYFIIERLSIGIRANYVMYKHEDKSTFSDGNTYTNKWNNMYITGMIDVNFYYIKKESFSLYSGAAIGASYNQSKISEITYKPNSTPGSEEYTKTSFAYHINAIGISVGKSIGGFLEAGYGFSGVINGGVYLNF